MACTFRLAPSIFGRATTRTGDALTLGWAAPEDGPGVAARSVRALASTTRSDRAGMARCYPARARPAQGISTNGACGVPNRAACATMRASPEVARIHVAAVGRGSPAFPAGILPQVP